MIAYAIRSVVSMFLVAFFAMTVSCAARQDVTQSQNLQGAIREVVLIKAAVYEHLSYKLREPAGRLMIETESEQEKEFIDIFNVRGLVILVNPSIEHRDDVKYLEGTEQRLVALYVDVVGMNDSTAFVRGYWRAGPTGAQGFDVVLKKVSGSWVVDKVKETWIS